MTRVFKAILSNFAEARILLAEKPKKLFVRKPVSLLDDSFKREEINEVIAEREQWMPGIARIFVFPVPKHSRRRNQIAAKRAFRFLALGKPYARKRSQCAYQRARKGK